MSYSNDLELQQAALSRLSSQSAEIRQSVLAYLVQGERPQPPSSRMSQLNDSTLLWSGLIVLPEELRLEIFRQTIASAFLEVEDTAPVIQALPACSTASHRRLRVKYLCSTDDNVDQYPEYLFPEYRLGRSLSWLKSWKVFQSPYHLAMSHLILAADTEAALPALTNLPVGLLYSESENYPFDNAIVTIDPIIYSTNPNYRYHGLEKIVLDFDALQYVDFFNVTCPPFNNPNVHQPDPLLCGAACVLQHCNELAIVFGEGFCNAHPWDGLVCEEWQTAKARTNICLRGCVVDWILEYAWRHGYIQHIKVMTIEGNIQPWVRQKWDDIFLNRREVHIPDIALLQSLGDVPGREWVPQEWYPPKCGCDVRCENLEVRSYDWRANNYVTWDDVEEEVGDPAAWDHVVYDDNDGGEEEEGEEEE